MPEIIASTYELSEKLGAGGGGTVYLANHLRLNKKVVLKADKRAVTTRPELLRREVDVLKNLSHPHIPQVYDYFVENDTVYTVMDYVQGESLDKPLKRGEKYPQPQVIKWARQLLGALSYLHSPTHGDPPRGYVHSDIKPANLMRTPDNNIYLIDFNIALALGEENVIGCSIGYASPEHYGLDFSSGYDTVTSTSESRMKENVSRKRRMDVGKAEPQKPSDRTEVTRNPAETELLKLSDKTEAAENPAETELLEPFDKTEVTGNLAETKRLEPLDKTAVMGNTAETTPLNPGMEMGHMLDSRSGTWGKASPSSAGNNAGNSSFSGKVIIPDVRSDIYSVGATLYHLLSGKRPARNATEVEALSDEEFSPQIVAIISRAMNPNPDLRYQTAEEMLDAFLHLRENDTRVQRRKRSGRMAAVLFSASFLLSVAVSFVGLKRMQTAQTQLTLAEYSANALREGDVSGAVRLALQAVPGGKSILEAAVMPQTQLALAEALGVYDLSDGFRALDSLELPSAPFHTVLSPEGSRLAVVYAYETAVFDLEEQRRIAVLPVQKSALADVVFTDEEHIIYAGDKGVAAYDLEKGEMLWTGDVAVTLAISADRTVAAAVDRKEDHAVLYRTTDGAKIGECSFQGFTMQAPANDIFADPGDTVFALNRDGSRLAVSFSNGGLIIFDINDAENGLIVYEESEYRSFDGGFSGDYFAFTGRRNGKSEFGIIDVEEGTYVSSYESANPLLVSADEGGIYRAEGSSLVRIDVDAQETTELAYTSDAVITAFSAGQEYTLTATEDGCISFYDSGAHLSSAENCGENCDFAVLSGKYAIVGNRSSTSLRVLQLDGQEEGELLSYDARYPHDEARISQDGRTAMFFDYKGFRIYDMSGEMLAEEKLPDPGQIYDQQFVRYGDGSWLEVTWYDGTVRRYNAGDGAMLSEEMGEPPSKDLEEEFITEDYRILSPLHAAPEVYDIKSGKLIATLKEDGYLTYVTQVEEYIIAEYLSAAGDGKRFGVLLDDRFRKIAVLPNLCDVLGNELVFDYESGNLRRCRLYSLEELVSLGEKFLEGQ